MLFASYNDENEGLNLNKVRKITDGFQKPSFRDRVVAQMGMETIPPATISSLLAESIAGRICRYFGHADLLAVTGTSKKFKEVFSSKVHTVKTPANAFMFAHRFYHICVRFHHIQLIQTCKSVGENGVKEIAETLRLGVCPNLKALVLAGSTVGEGAMTELSSALASGNCAKLTKLDLGVNFLGDSGVRQLAAALAGHVCPRLASLTLTFSYLGGGCVAELCTTLATNCCPSLAALNIQFNELDDAGFTIFCEALGKGKDFLPTLTDLTLGKEINETSVKRLCRALATRPAPVYVQPRSFSNSKRRKNRKISHDIRTDIESLAGASATASLTATPSSAIAVIAPSALNVLNLNDNPLGDKGLRVLCGALETTPCCRIRELGLGNTSLGITGVKALCQVISKGLLPQLERLCLADNGLGASSLQALQEALIQTVPDEPNDEKERGKEGAETRQTGVTTRGGSARSGSRKRSSCMTGSMQNISIQDRSETHVCNQLQEVDIGADVSEMAFREFISSLTLACPRLKLV
jgi:hypothetical protein